jgi:flagellar biosynthetic protein FlhB
MSNSDDKESKTEEPTEHRLRTAVEQGNIPSSREVATFAPLAAALVVLIYLAQGTSLHVVQFLAGFIERPGEWSLLTGTAATTLFHAALTEAAWVIVPAVTILAAAGIAGACVQNQPRIVVDRIQPKLSRISIKAGWSRLFGARGFVEFGKALFKLLVITVIAVQYLLASKADVLNTMFMEPAALPNQVFKSCATLFAVFVVTSLVLVVADWFWVRFSWKRDLRMTRQELKEEMKQLQGDPVIKARLRSLARDRARRRMMASVPRATLVIANPTHYAVALRYVRGEGGAPVVLAKGKDLIALRIREIAEQKGIPVVEDKPLARSLYDSVEIDKMIPPEFYRAVAKIILFLTSRGRLGHTA